MSCKRIYTHEAMFYRRKHRRTSKGFRSFPTKLGAHKFEAKYLDLCGNKVRTTSIYINEEDLKKFNPPDQSAGVNYREVAKSLLEAFTEPKTLLNFCSFTPKTISDCTEFVKQYYERENSTSS